MFIFAVTPPAQRRSGTSPLSRPAQPPGRFTSGNDTERSDTAIPDRSCLLLLAVGAASSPEGFESAAFTSGKQRRGNNGISSFSGTSDWL